MKNQRPVYLNLFAIRFPLTALVSILHRASGVLLFLLIPLGLWLLEGSVRSQPSFDQVCDLLSHGIFKFIFWGLLGAFIYHFLAGIRHLIMDAGVGESLKSGRCSAAIVILLTLILMSLAGVWLW